MLRSPCLHPRCPHYAESGAYCKAHRPKIDTAQKKERRLSYSRAGWRGLRERVIAERPLCEDCGEAWSVEVHHVVKKASGGTDEDSNLRALCKSCHSTRTARGE